MITWHLETRKIKDLKPHPKNPRRLTKDQALHLETSLDKFGLIDKPIINTNDLIIGGHQRINLLKKQKIKDVECWVPERPLEHKEVEELMIRLNKAHGEFNWDDLGNNFEVSDLIDYGFTLDDFELPDSESGSPAPPKEGEKCPVCGKTSKAKK